MPNSRPRPRPAVSRTSSHDHRPWNPSSLRQTYTASASPPTSSDGPTNPSAVDDDSTMAPHSLAGPSSPLVSLTEETSLLGGGEADSAPGAAHPKPCDHGTFSSRPATPTDYAHRSMLFSDGSEGSTLSSRRETASPGDDWWTRLARTVRSKKMSQTSALAERAGFEDSLIMYLGYYIPCITWLRQYSPTYLKGDLISALTMASMYLPMALSLADNLAHVAPIHGLYSFAVNPLMYGLLGSCTPMIVGPEAPGSLLVGSVIKSAVDAGLGGIADDDEEMHARILGVVVGMSGAIVLLSGLTRLGWLDNVLSKPFLRGFVSAIGVVIIVEQLVPELGLAQLSEEMGVNHGSAVDKLLFIVGNLSKAHRLTFWVSLASITTIMACRELKRHFQPRYLSVAYLPDRFLVVLFSSILCAQLNWQEQGLDILGKIETPSGGLFNFRWPILPSNMGLIRHSLSTAFLIALLGFFESSVAAKSLGNSNSKIKGVELSANRELVALGSANLIGACFMGLPAFGGYGRSKVNLATGGKTPMSSIFLGLIAIICTMFLLPAFYFVPKPVLCAMISVVGWSLIEEAPHDIAFFLQIHAWRELALMAIIFVATMFYSLTLGMAIGVGLSVLQVVYHATRSRIQILGRIPGTDRFENAEFVHSAYHPRNAAVDDEELERQRLEFIEGCLIVKIPEPLTFANTGELKSRLRRLERYGTHAVHPALPPLRGDDSNRNVVFDIHGVTSLDGAGIQVLEEIVREYRELGVRVFFSRGPWPKATATGRGGSRSNAVGGLDGSNINNGAGTTKNHPVWKMIQRAGLVELVGGEHHFVDDVQQAIKMTEALEEERSPVADV